MAYFENSSIHGFSTIHLSKSKTEKLFWLFMLLACSVLLGLLIRNNINRYFEHEIKVTTSYNIQKTPMEFPAVTLCNANRYLSYKIDELIEEFYPNGTLDKDNYTESMRVLKSISWEKTLTMRQSIHNFFSPGVFNFNGIPVNPNTSMARTLSDGTCFTFNLNDETLNQLIPGAKSSLEIVAYIDQDTYFTTDFYLNSQPAGVHVMIHNREDEANIKDVIIASPHHVTDIAVGKVVTQRLPYPFSDNCYKSYEEIKTIFPLITSFNYTIDICWKSCYIFELNKTCGIVDQQSYWDAMLVNIYYPLPNESETIKAEKCIFKFNAMFYSNMRICKCYNLCEKTSYEFTIQKSSWPPKVAMPFWIERMKQRLDRNVSKSYINKNLVAIKIYYRQFGIKSIVHSPSFTKATFVANMGGLMGLLLGASMFSIIELFSFLIKSLADTVKNKRFLERNYNDEH